MRWGPWSVSSSQSVVVAACPGAVPGGWDPAVYRPGWWICGTVWRWESLFTFKPQRWCDSLYRRGWHRALRERERERMPAVARGLEEVCRWLEVLRGIVSALFQRDVGRRGGSLRLFPPPSASSYCRYSPTLKLVLLEKGSLWTLALPWSVCLDLQGQKVIRLWSN